MTLQEFINRATHDNPEIMDYEIQINNVSAASSSRDITDHIHGTKVGMKARSIACYFVASVVEQKRL